LITLKSEESVESLRAIFPEEALCICGFPVKGVENWQRVSGGFFTEEHRILNIDHRAPHPDVARPVSIGNLAAEYVRENGPIEMRIINNHTDCDSIISRLIVGGRIPPHPYLKKL